MTKQRDKNKEWGHSKLLESNLEMTEGKAKTRLEQT